MWHGLRRIVLVGTFLVSGGALAASPAGAAIAPTASLDQSAGTTAGGSHNLGVNLNFAPTGSDSPDDMTLTLPPGLLANASVDNGACLSAVDLQDSACHVGSGTVTAEAYGYIPIPTPVTFDLVPPPAPGDLAGLAVNADGTQVGSTADIKIRPSGSPAGVGVSIDFVLPNSLYGVPISITQISSTFDGLRYPTTCPSTPQAFTVSANSYSDPAVHTVSAPLSVTGCSGLPFSPGLKVSATRDTGDSAVKLTSTVTQSASEAPSRGMSLSFPVSVLTPNIGSIKLLCANLSSGTCRPVGSVTADSPLYPKPLTGEAYLTGTFTGPTLTLTFPSPFPLTLTGAVNLASDRTTFNGLPDIPLTNLAVTLNSGRYGLFDTTCRTPSGTATVAATDQNGDKTAHAPTAFSVAGCPARGGGSAGKPSTGRRVGRTTLSQARLSGLRTGHPTLTFRLSTPRTAKLTSYTITLPRGLRLTPHRRHHKLTLTGVTLKSARIRKLTLNHGHLTITLRTPSNQLTTTIGPRALTETRQLKAKASAHTHRLTSLPLTITTHNTRHQHTTIHAHITHLGL